MSTESAESTECTGISETFRVQGMSCGHCVAAVTGEVAKLAGVRAVVVDLPIGAVTVTSDAPLAHDAVVAAVNEAGYELVDP